jgi:MFS superfamily sulfate permease-like transporter
MKKLASLICVRIAGDFRFRPARDHNKDSDRAEKRPRRRPWITLQTRIPLLDASDRVEAVEEWNSECALAEKFQRLIAVKRMVKARANVSEQPFERQPLEI